jgi:hypothetical protein
MRIRSDAGTTMPVESTCSRHQVPDLRLEGYVAGLLSQRQGLIEDLCRGRQSPAEPVDAALGQECAGDAVRIAELAPNPERFVGHWFELGRRSTQLKMELRELQCSGPGSQRRDR